MSIRCQHSEEQRSFRSECCSDLFWLCPTCCHLYWCVVEERNKWLWSQLEESMALNQFLCPCCWRAVAACSILSWSFTDCQRAGGNKHIPRRSCCKADCQNCTERGGGEISQSMQGWWHLFTTIDCIHKNKIKKKQGLLFLPFLQNNVYRFRTGTWNWRPGPLSIQVKQCKCLPLLTVASFCLAS